MVIYKTTNLINGKFYVGKDQKNNPDYLGSGLVLNRAIIKHGRENFKKEILEHCDSKDELSNREIYWIETLSAITNGYNIALGGSGGDTYSSNPNLPKIIEKLSGSNNHFFCKTHSEESKTKMSNSQMGRVAWNEGKTGIYSDETLKKMSDTRTKMTGETSSRYIKIDDSKLKEVLLSNNIKDTSKYFNVSVSCIRRKIKDFGIVYEDIKKERLVKVNISPNYYKISDDVFNEILKIRENDKKSFEELSDIFNIGVNKLRKEFKDRKIKVERIK